MVDLGCLLHEDRGHLRPQTRRGGRPG
jgi:hypothetical protein